MALLKNLQSNPHTDSELVTQYQQTHQQDVLAQLFLRYSDLVYGCCLKYLSDPENAKDAVMNIYEELVEKLKIFKIENFKSWLYTVSKNHCLMLLRKLKKSTFVEIAPDFMQSDEFSHLDKVLEKEQQLTLLEHCMEHLAMDQKQSVKLFYLENKCYNDIMDVTGHDWNKVRSLIQNARRNLKICMEQHA